MPLIESCDAAAYLKNVQELIRSGRDPQQAAAIAHTTLRDACKKAGKPTPSTTRK